MVVGGRRLDPLGFALETFDPIGRTRKADDFGLPIDDSAELKDGTKFQGLAGLRAYIAKHQAEFNALLSRKLITTAGRKQVIGRPILYKTTKEFLLRFGLKDVSELPSMEEFEKIAASELSEASEETESGFEHVESAGPELDPDASENGEAAPAAESSAPETAGAPDAEATASEPAPETVPEPQAEAVSHD